VLPDVPELEPEALATEQEVHGLLPPWPLWEELGHAGVSCVLLSKFASEGDNTADALQLAEKLLQLLKALAPLGGAEGGSAVTQLKIPCSWSAALYGGRERAAAVAAGDLIG
jgi:hypothetical protein